MMYPLENRPSCVKITCVFVYRKSYTCRYHPPQIKQGSLYSLDYYYKSFTNIYSNLESHNFYLTFTIRLRGLTTIEIEYPHVNHFPNRLWCWSTVKARTLPLSSLPRCFALYCGSVCILIVNQSYVIASGSIMPIYKDNAKICSQQIFHLSKNRLQKRLAHQLRLMHAKNLNKLLNITSHQRLVT